MANPRQQLQLQIYRAEQALAHYDHEQFLAVVKKLPTDYQEYGGTIERWADENAAYPDCSCGCRWARKLDGQLGFDWVVCAKRDGPRAGLLTFEHQTGSVCFESDDDE